MLQDVLQWLGAGDQALKVMGPCLTIVLAWVFGGAAAQLLKYPLARAVKDGPAFNWLISVIGIAATIYFAHRLSGSVPGVLEIGAGITEPMVYLYSLKLIRHYWPWLEVSLAVGAIAPPAAAFEAAAQRKADQVGQESGQ